MLQKELDAMKEALEKQTRELAALATRGGSTRRGRSGQRDESSEDEYSYSRSSRVGKVEMNKIPTVSKVRSWFTAFGVRATCILRP